jgi:hypothetical protein
MAGFDDVVTWRAGLTIQHRAGLAALRGGPAGSPSRETSGIVVAGRQRYRRRVGLGVSPSGSQRCESAL